MILFENSYGTDTPISALGCEGLDVKTRRVFGINAVIISFVKPVVDGPADV